MYEQWQPFWTTETKIENGGLYPLGLNRFHNALEGLLIRGIVLAANRLRYYTYSCWIVGDIQRNESCHTHEEFVEAFNRRENALGIGLYLMQPDYGIPGSDAISKIVDDNKSEYNCSFKLMQSNILGAYGLYYSGSIYSWGLTETDDKGFIRLTKSGHNLYMLFEQYLQNTKPKYYTEYKGKNNVPTEILLEWGKANDFNNIIDHPKERAFFKTILFRLNQNNVTDYRRDTFLLFLISIEQCSKNDVFFTENTLTDIHYYQSYYDNKRKVVYQIDIPTELQNAIYYWKLYEGHVFFRGWVSRYFDVFLTYLKTKNSGCTIDDFLSELNESQFKQVFNHFTGIAMPLQNKAMDEVLSLISSPTSLQASYSISNITSDKEFESPSEIMAKFVIVIASLYKTFKDERKNPIYMTLQTNLQNDLWLDVLFRFRDFENTQVIDLLRTILKKYIIQQHDQIMIEKKDLRRSWFTTENNHYFHEADLSIIWRPAKFSTISQFLEDLNLIRLVDEMTELTDEGELFLNEFNLQGSLNEQ